MLKKERLENLTNEIWKAAIKLRGKFKAKDYPAVILPMIMIRRIECVLIEKRNDFEQELKAKTPDIDDETLLKRIKIKEQNLSFYNKSSWTLKGILEEATSQVESNFRDYLNNFSENIDEIIDKFNYRNTVGEIVKAKRLSSIIRLVAEEDFSLQRLSNLEMGYVYEELLQRFTQDDAKDTGEHFTPREIIRIMVDLLEIDFNPKTAKQAISIYDPACGTGGMLSIAKEYLSELAENNEDLKQVEELVLLNGQELLPSNYAVCKADMILKGESHINITNGNSLIPDNQSIEEEGDLHSGEYFDYMISNPPFGVNWSEYKSDVNKFATTRFKWGMPSSDDGALLFLLTMIEKMKPKKDGGSKIAILFNGSPLSNQDATQGSSEIRRHILENDLLDSIIMLPDQMFYNTGIYTYVWILNNNKPKDKKDKVLIINAREQFEKEPKSFGNKRNRITETHREWIKNSFSEYSANDNCKLFDCADFAYHKVKIVFWQEDENDKPMYITESFTKKVNNSNVKNEFNFYGDLKFKISIADIEFNISYDGKKPFENIVADKLKSLVTDLKNSPIKDVKKWFQQTDKEVEYTHRHYISDNEYIPFDKSETDKKAYINNFLAKEIDYQIIFWEEYEQLGYEILPNKYFYKYEEPISSNILINEFWQLEKDAEKLLSEIKEL